jgi:hypothetical protein
MASFSSASSPFEAVSTELTSGLSVRIVILDSRLSSIQNADVLHFLMDLYP